MTEYPVRRNTILLAAANALASGLGQLSAAIATITFALVTGVELLLGLGPAIFMGAAAAAAFPAGRAMDRVGRMPVIAAGYVLGIVGCIVTGTGALAVSTALVVLGFLLIGASTGILQLSRTAAGDMYPPERRARGIAYVLFGAVFGAILGPVVFTPLFSGRELEAEALAVPWYAATGFMVGGLLLVLMVRPDPKTIAEAIAARGLTEGAKPEHVDLTPQPLSVVLRRPGVLPALVAAVASVSVMATVMLLMGSVLVDRGHDQASIFPVIGAHMIGMFGLVLFVGELVDRIGRKPALVGGLLLEGVACLSLIWLETPAATAVPLFLLGLGWNVSFVAATAELVDLTRPAERGKLLGATDLLASGMNASLVILGGLALSLGGVATIAIGALVLAVVPAVAILGSRARPRLATA
jgi:MFS family permease